jgi:ribosomal-protein-alanine N-acetyltransferase
VALEQDGQLAGYAGFWLVAGEAQVTRVAVAQTLQGQGLGTRLTAALVEAAWDAGATAVTLEVRTSNLAAQKAYGLRTALCPQGCVPIIMMTTVKTP